MKKHETTLWESENFGYWRPSLKHPATENIGKARGEIIREVRSMYDLKEKIEADGTRTADAKRVAVRDAGTRVAKRILDSGTAAEAATVKSFAEIRQKYEKARAPKSAAEEQRRATMRASLAALSANDRMKIFRQALVDRDAETIAAVATGKQFESQVIPLQYAEANAAFDELTAPDDYKVQAELKDGLAYLEHARRAAQALIEKEFVTPGVETAESAKVARDLLAAVSEGS